jgi:Spy/CpxP family protein refolding chaperone
MKKLLFFLLLLASANFVNAQDDTKEADSRLDVIKKELSLSDEQASKIKEAMKKRRIAVKDAQEINRKTRREAHEQFDNDMKTILTPDQLKKYEERKDDMSTPQGRAERLVNRLDKQLELNDEQAKKVETAALTRFTKLSEIEKGKGSKDARETINAAFDTELKTILSPEQFAKYQKGGKGGHNGHGGGKGKGKGK